MENTRWFGNSMSLYWNPETPKPWINKTDGPSFDPDSLYATLCPCQVWYLISLSFTFVVDDDASIIEIFLRIRLLLLSFVFVFIKRVRLDNVVEKDEKDDDVVA